MHCSDMRYALQRYALKNADIANTLKSILLEKTCSSDEIFRM